MAWGQGVVRTWGPAVAGLRPYGSVALSLLLFGVILRELGSVDLAGALAEMPLSPLFYVAFLCFFLLSPGIEWLILRRLWQAPLSGLRAILQKMVYNELLVSYLGDAYLFAWIKRELPHVTAPFAVVKDMAIVSAFMGSMTTLAAIALAWPFFPQVDQAGLGTSVLLALSLPLASGGAIALFRDRLLSLPRAQILWIGAACGTRFLAQNAIAVVMWWSLLPQVPLTTWIVLAVVRMVSTRLPLIPNKDLAFAAVTVALVGSEDRIASVIVLITSFVLMANILLAVALSVESWGRALARRGLAPA